MSTTAHSKYFIQLYRAVLEARGRDEAPLAFSLRVHDAVNHYLKDEYQNPEPPLSEV